MKVIIEKKADTVNMISKIMLEKQGDLSIVVITDAEYAMSNGFQGLVEEVDMNENNVIIVKS